MISSLSRIFRAGPLEERSWIKDRRNENRDGRYSMKIANDKNMLSKQESSSATFALRSKTSVTKLKRQKLGVPDLQVVQRLYQLMMHTLDK